jgi:hypothetical protein
MSLNLSRRDPNLHLRDARHAHQLFTESNHAFSPKVKFLYHMQFELTQEAREASPNSSNFQKEISVLAKTVDLPQYRATVETVQQYNRKKNIQTRIDYDDVRISYYDDNTGITRSLLHEYYLYYFRDNSKNDGSGNPVQFDARDKFRDVVYRYGMDNEKRDPFFRWIKIFQLSRQEWFSYTLINPLLTAWGHDSLDYADGAGIMENTLSMIYEGVLYNNGFIDINADPAGFASPETRYDTVPSPLTGMGTTILQPTITEPDANSLNYENDVVFVDNGQGQGGPGLIQTAAQQAQQQISNLPGLEVPVLTRGPR